MNVPSDLGDIGIRVREELVECLLKRPYCATRQVKLKYFDHHETRRYVDGLFPLYFRGKRSGCLLDLIILYKKIMNSKQKGNITELEAMLAFLKFGYNVLTPYGDCERYDFVVDVNGKFIRVQAKTSNTEDDGASFKFSCRSCNRKDGKIVHHTYSNDEIDYFVTTFNGKCYLVPVEECGADKRLRILPTKNGRVRGITWAKDYELEEVVKNW